MAHRNRTLLTSTLRVLQICTATLAVAGSAYATQLLKPNQYDLSRLGEELRAVNPQLKQSKNSYEAAREVGKQQSAPDNPTIGLTNNPIMKGNARPDLVESNYLNTGYYYSITQNIYFPGKKGLMGEVADKQAEFTRTRITSTELQLQNQLETNFFQAYAVTKMLEEVKHQIIRLEQIKLSTKIRYGNNAADFSDYISTQVAHSTAEKDQMALNRQLTVLKGNINTLIGRKPSEPLELIYDHAAGSSPKDGVNQLVDRAMFRNPDVEGASHLKDAATKSVDLAKMNYLPDFQVSAFANKQTQLWQSANILNYGAQVNLIVPWIIFDKEKSSVSQARANLRASEENESNVKQQVRLTVENAHVVLHQSMQEAAFTRDRVLPEAQAAYRIALQNYTNAKLNFADLINAQNNLKNAELQLISAEVNVLIARSNLEAAIGEKLQ